MSNSNNAPKELKPLNPNQKLLINSIKTSPMTITTGAAGTGKTFVTSWLAAEFFKTKRVRKIVITRPNVPTGKSIGFFPGSLEEKMSPWVIPVVSTLEEYLGKSDVEYHLKKGNIEIVPFETIRGRSFEDSFVILDEAQNTTIPEMKAFLSRVGERSIVVVNGDTSQTDLLKETNGLSYSLSLLSRSEELQRYVKHVHFTLDDIVRSGLCRLWVEAFEEDTETLSDCSLPRFLMNP